MAYIFKPPWSSEFLKCVIPPCPRNSIIVNLLPVWIFHFFSKPFRSEYTNRVHKHVYAQFGLFYAKLFQTTLLLFSAACNQVYCYHCLTDAAYINFIYHSFKMFPQFWLAKSTHIIHHNQSLMTKFGRISCLMRKWRQKYSLLQVHALLTKKTWGRGWVVLVVNLKNGRHFTRFKSKN